MLDITNLNKCLSVNQMINEFIIELSSDKEGLISYLSNPSRVIKYTKTDNMNNYLGCLRVIHWVTPHKFIPLIFYFFADNDFLVINGNEV